MNDRPPASEIDRHPEHGEFAQHHPDRDSRQQELQLRPTVLPSRGAPRSSRAVPSPARRSRPRLRGPTQGGRRPPRRGSAIADGAAGHRRSRVTPCRTGRRRHRRCTRWRTTRRRRAASPTTAPRPSSPPSWPPHSGTCASSRPVDVVDERERRYRSLDAVEQLGLHRRRRRRQSRVDRDELQLAGGEEPVRRTASDRLRPPPAADGADRPSIWMMSSPGADRRGDSHPGRVVHDREPTAATQRGARPAHRTLDQVDHDRASVVTSPP